MGGENLTNYTEPSDLSSGSGDLPNSRNELQAGRKAFQGGDFETAIRHFQCAIASDPSSVAAKLRLAEVFKKLNDDTQVEQICLSIVETHPRNASAHNLLGHVLWRRGDLTSALSHFQVAAAEKPDQENIRLVIARILKELICPEDAAKIYRRLIEKNPENAEARKQLSIVALKLGRTAFQGGDFETALRHFHDTLISDPASLAARLHLVGVFRRLNDHALVEQLWQGILACPDQGVAAYESVLEDSAATGDFDLAREVVARAPKSLSETPEFRFRVQLHFHEIMFDHSAALALLDGLEVTTISPDAGARISYFLISARQAHRAVELLGRVLPRFPHNRRLVRAYLEAVFIARGRGAVRAEWQGMRAVLSPSELRSALHVIPISSPDSDELITLFDRVMNLAECGFRTDLISKFIDIEAFQLSKSCLDRLNTSRNDYARLVGGFLATREADIIRLTNAASDQSVIEACRLAARQLAVDVDEALCNIAQQSESATSFIQVVSKLQRNSRRARAAWLNSREAYADAVSFADWLAERIRNREPTAAIRLGDGEGNFLPYPDDQAIYQARDRKSMQIERWWGEERLDGEKANEISSRLQGAIAAADSVGVIPVSRVLAVMPTTASTNRFRRGWLSVQRYFDDVEPDLLHDKILTSWNIPADLDQWDLYERIFAPASAISVVSCHDLSGYLKDNFDVTVRTWFEVPEAKAFSGLFGRDDTADRAQFYPDIFDNIMRDIAPLPGELFLVGAGLLGKLICQKVRETGGVALDIGSLADYWVGFGTRHHVLSRPLASTSDDSSQIKVAEDCRRITKPAACENLTDLLRLGRELAMSGREQEASDVVDRCEAMAPPNYRIAIDALKWRYARRLKHLASFPNGIDSIEGTDWQGAAHWSGVLSRLALDDPGLIRHHINALLYGRRFDDARAVFAAIESPGVREKVAARLYQSMETLEAQWQSRDFIYASEAPAFLNRGVPVVPTFGKKPVPVGWDGLSKRLPTQDEIESWMTLPWAGIGLVTGEQSGIAIMDVDAVDPVVAGYIEAALPPSPWRRVGRYGMALAYRWTGLPSVFYKDRSGGGLFDLVSKRRFVALPPSVHPETGQRYAANSSLLDVLDELQPLPADYAERINHVLISQGITPVLGKRRLGHPALDY